MIHSGGREYTRAELRWYIEHAGVCPGDVLIVHSSLKAIGWITGGPINLIRALRDVLGSTGTLIMPTFTFSLAGWDFPPFNPSVTRSRVGLLTDTFWRLPGVIRSIHPTHSFAAQGPLAGDMTRNALEYQPLGIGSTVDRARQAGAKILLLGVGQDRNSTVHLAESMSAMPYLRVPFAVGCEYDMAKISLPPACAPERVRITEMPGSSEGFAVLDERLPKLGVARDVPLGETPCQIMDSRELCDSVVEMLAEDPYLFLRGPEPTAISNRRRDFLDEYYANRSQSTAI